MTLQNSVFFQKIKHAKSDILDIFNNNANYFLSLILSAAPFLIIYEFKQLIIDSTGERFVLISDWIKLLTYSYIIYKTLQLVLGEDSIPKDSIEKFKNYIIFVFKIILFFIVLRSIPMVLGLFAVSINYLIPFLAVKTLSNTVFFVIALYFVVRVCYILPDHIVGKPLNLKKSFLKTKTLVSEMILAGFYAGLAFIVILALFNNLMPFAENLFISSDSKLINEITKDIINLPIALFIEPYILIIGSITIGYYYKKSYDFS